MDGFVIPRPILFNPLKHHLGYINSFVRNYLRSELSNLRSKLSIIGESQMDLYLGALSITALTNEIKLIISTRYIDDNDSFIQYINECSGFDKITLSDGSAWVLKVGHVPGRFVHIHPARYSPQSVRIKANTLKTLIATNIVNSDKTGLEDINVVRSELLGLEKIQNLSVLNKYQELFYNKHFVNESPSEITAIQ